jgi:hypothetical protein
MSASRNAAFGSSGVLGSLKVVIRRTAQNGIATLNPILTWRPGLKDLLEVLLLAAALPLYYLVRGMTHQEVPDAVSRGVEIIRLEKSLGIFWEMELQSWIISYAWLVKLLNWFYLFGHLPVIGALAVWLYFWHRPQYLLMRNAFLLSGAIALIFYVNFPTAPPRLLPDYLGYNFVDTVVQQYQESRPLTPSFFVNEYAAFPSMHIGWNLLVAIAIWMASRNILVRLFAVLMPLAMLTDILLTANHYIIDAGAGFLVMLTGLAIAAGIRYLVLRRFSPDSRPDPDRGWLGWLYWLCGVPTPGERAAEATTEA